ncbi:MAG: TetR family transcriptional regulator [Ktedonobacteraceae bacterium]|nr:TetR family transcriptional regulator [Ktedonobacteraceae bacterium]
MTDGMLTRERILDVAEDVLRRFGPAKATVVDVARVLGVSHGSVYRHFPSKAALRDAVAERWLAEISQPLEAIAAEEGSATTRLRRWFDLLITAKRTRALDDPELFATYVELAESARGVIKAHVDQLVDHLTRIITAGIAQGEFAVTDPGTTAWAVYNATIRFHKPIHAPEWSNPSIDSDFEGVWSLILHGLTHPPNI